MPAAERIVAILTNLPRAGAQRQTDASVSFYAGEPRGVKRTGIRGRPRPKGDVSPGGCGRGYLVVTAAAPAGVTLGVFAAPETTSLSHIPATAWPGTPHTNA